MPVDVDDLPEHVRNKARAVGAQRWLAELPEVVRALEVEWEVTVGAVLPGGTEALVAEVACVDGTDAVLKVLIPRDEGIADHEITVLELAGGEGCPLLLRADRGRHAMLVERLGRSLNQLHLPLAQRHDVLCAAAARLWRPAAGRGLPTGADKAAWLVEFVTKTWADLDEPCEERTVAEAIAAAQRRMAAHDDERSVLVHGDVHEWNALQTLDGSTFKLVDPDGLLAEPEYDLGILMREDPEELLAGDPLARARDLAARAGLDPVAIWEWGVIERVSTGLVCTQIDLQPVGRQMLHAADVVAGLRP